MNGLNRWIYVVCGVVLLVFAGLVYAWTVLAVPIAEEFPNWGKGELSLTFTITMMAFCLGGFVGGIVSKNVPVRITLWIGAVLFLAGFFLSSSASALMQLYIGFGMLSGFASGLAYNGVMGNVLKWFPDKQGLISGILLMGFGIGAFLIGKIYTAVLAGGSLTWRDAFRAMAILLCAVMAVSGFIIRKPTDAEAKTLPAPPASAGGKGSKAKSFRPTEMLAQSSFWFYALWAVLLSAAAMALIAQASGVVREVSPDLEAGTVATIVGLISIFNGVGRVLFGGMFDKIGYRKNMLFNDGLYLCAVLVIIFGLQSKNLVLLVCGFILFGLSYGGVTPTNSAFINSFFGAEHYAVNFSIINLNLLFASFGGTIAGVVYDRQQSYLGIFFLMIAAIAGGTVCTFLIRRPKS